MALYRLLLKGFEFPSDLADNKANFRFFFYLRHFDATSKTWVTAEAVSPSLSAYWECDRSKKDQESGVARYIRDGDRPKFNPLPAWDEVVVMVNTRALTQLRVAVFDVNRKDWTDTLREIGEGIVGSLFSAANTLPVPALLGTPTGTLLEHVKKSVLDSFAKEDDLLFRMDTAVPAAPPDGDFALTADGYVVRLSWDRVEEPVEGEAIPAARRGKPTTDEQPPVGGLVMVDNRSVFARVITSATAAKAPGASKQASRSTAKSTVKRGRR